MIKSSIIKEAPIFRVGQKVAIDGYLLDNKPDGTDCEAMVLTAYDNGDYLLKAGDGYAIAAELLIMGEPFNSRWKVKGLHLVFFGNGILGIDTLRRLNDQGAVIDVVTSSSVSPIYRAATELGIHTTIVADINGEGLVDEIAAIGANVAVCVDFKLIPQSIINIFPFGIINLHSSLLPAGRGSSAVFQAIRDGDTEAGVSTILIDGGIDRGNIINNLSIAIGNADTAGSLTQRLAANGAVMMEDAILRVLDGEKGSPQADIHNLFCRPSHTPRLKTADFIIHPDMTADEAMRLIRACSPAPYARINLVEGGIMKIIEASVVKPRYSFKPGVVYTSKRRLFVSVKDALLSVVKLQLSGGKVLTTPDFINGHPDFFRLFS